MKAVLTIAGSDSSGGAGIQADIKTMLANGVYAMSAVTALTAQNTRGVYDVMEARPSFLTAQLAAVFEDIPPDAVKIGMVASKPLIETIGAFLRVHPVPFVVVDPVMVATSGARLLAEAASEALTQELFPLATLLTPNLPEAEALTGVRIEGEAGMERAAKALLEAHGAAVLLKGGHGKAPDDFLLTKEGGTWLRGRRIATKNTHGTGCTLSSAIAANLAKGMDLLEACRGAKAYVEGALAAGLDLGAGSGPLDHGYRLR